MVFLSDDFIVYNIVHIWQHSNQYVVQEIV